MAWCVKWVGGVGFVLFRLFVLLTAGVRVLSRCFKVVVARGLRATGVYNYGGGAWDILLMTRSTGRPKEFVCVIESFHSLIIGSYQIQINGMGCGPQRRTAQQSVIMRCSGFDTFKRRPRPIRSRFYIPYQDIKTPPLVS